MALMNNFKMYESFHNNHQVYNKYFALGFLGKIPFTETDFKTLSDIDDGVSL